MRYLFPHATQYLRKNNLQGPAQTRISGDGRLTLVIHPPSIDQRTYWALSELDALDAARANLAERENMMVLDSINWVRRDHIRDHSDSVEARVRSWCEADHRQLDAVIWTGLLPTLQGRDVVEAAVTYLDSLNAGEIRDRAREYVAKAPPQIQTAVRQEMRKRGWTDVELPAALFEDP